MSQPVNYLKLAIFTFISLFSAPSDTWAFEASGATDDLPLYLTPNNRCRVSMFVSGRPAALYLNFQFGKDSSGKGAQRMVRLDRSGVHTPNGLPSSVELSTCYEGSELEDFSEVSWHSNGHSFSDADELGVTYVYNGKRYYHLAVETSGGIIWLTRTQAP